MNIQFKEFKINKYLFYSIIIFIFLAGFIIQFYVIKNRKQNSSTDLPQLPQVQDAAIVQNLDNSQNQTSNEEINNSKGGILTSTDSKVEKIKDQPAPANTISYQPEDYSYSFSQSQSQSIKANIPSENISINISQHQSQSN
jgi:hypothetical protein